MTVDVNVYDGAIPEDLRKEVWEYINSQEWLATWKGYQPYNSTYVPANETFMAKSHKIMSVRMPNMYMHRCGFARQENELKTNHPVIGQLWDLINEQLGNRYDINGPAEDITLLEHPDTPGDTVGKGWRVYCNAQMDESIKHSHGAHRDNKDVNDPYTRTILYVANLEWYPTWFAECIYYPDDTEGTTGDTQQFHKKFGGQARGFPVGWAEQIVSPVPGRIISYDSRTLHTTRPAAIWAESMRKVVVFRVRLKPEFQNTNQG